MRTEPPIPRGCTSDSDCPTDRACEQSVCISPCAYDPCAKYATCIVVNHKAVCTCISDYSGDPYQKDDGCSKAPLDLLVFLFWGGGGGVGIRPFIRPYVCDSGVSVSIKWVEIIISSMISGSNQ